MKKFIAVLITTLTLFVLLSINSFALSEKDIDSNVASSVGELSYLISKADRPTKFVIEKDIRGVSNLSIRNGKVIIIDLNGYNLELGGNIVLNSGHLMIIDSKNNKNAKFKMYNDGSHITIDKNSTLFLANRTLFFYDYDSKQTVVNNSGILFISKNTGMHLSRVNTTPLEIRNLVSSMVISEDGFKYDTDLFKFWYADGAKKVNIATNIDLDYTDVFCALVDGKLPEIPNYIWMNRNGTTQYTQISDITESVDLLTYPATAVAGSALSGTSLTIAIIGCSTVIALAVVFYVSYKKKKKE